MKLSNSSGQSNSRRQKVLLRLKEQLSSSVKGVVIEYEIHYEALTPEDIERIKAEIKILEQKVTSDANARATRTKKYRGA